MGKNNSKIILLLFLGFLTPILTLFVPVDGGGVSLIFVVTVPILIVISILSSIVYFYLDKWKFSSERKNMLFLLFCTTLVALAFLLYPYKQQ